VNRTNFLRILLTAAAAAALAAGILRGAPFEIMRKAIIICAECIGIG